MMIQDATLETVYTVMLKSSTPFMMATDVLYRLGHRNVDSHHHEYRKVLRLLHKLKDDGRVRNSNIPEANVTIWWAAARIVPVALVEVQP